jgi:general stress protein 26
VTALSADIRGRTAANNKPEVYTMQNVLDAANNLHKKAKFFFLGSVDNNGFPNIKAVLPVNKRESIRHIYFSTNTSSKHVAQYRANPKSCVYFYSPLFFKGVLLKGVIEVVEATEIKKRFWNKGDLKYYPKGVTDPDYCILKFTAQEGRYYSNFKSNDFVIE